MNRLICLFLSHTPDFFLEATAPENAPSHDQKGFRLFSKPTRFMVLTSHAGKTAEFDVCTRCGEIARINPPGASVRALTAFVACVVVLIVALAALSRLS